MSGPNFVGHTVLGIETERNVVGKPQDSDGDVMKSRRGMSFD